MIRASWNHGSAENGYRCRPDGKGVVYVVGSDGCGGEDSLEMNIDEIDDLIEQLQSLKREWKEHVNAVS